MIKPQEYTTDFVTSKDGTKIHYRQIGSGDGLILVHGALMYSKDFTTLAELLSDNFTIYIPDRSGRGLSEMHKNYSLIAESEDLQALLDKTNARYVFGLSAGAIIALQTAINNSSIKKIAVFEPPIYSKINSTQINAVIEKYNSSIEKQKIGKAFISITKGIGDSKSVMTYLPSFITAPLMNIAINAEAKKKLEEDEVTLKSLIMMAKYDLEISKQSFGMEEKLKNISADILLLGGEKSHYIVKETLKELIKKLPNVKRKVFLNTGHITANNVGKPELVANELRNFFST